MILDKPVNLEVVQTFRGVVDFYTWKGINVARAWPKKPNQPNTPSQIETRKAFSASITWIKTNPVSWNHQWSRMQTPIGITTDNMKRKTALQLAYAGALVSPPDIVNITLFPVPVHNQTTVVIRMSASAPYDPGFVTFRWIPYTTDPWPLTYSSNIEYMDRQNMPKIRYTPVVSTYQPPVSTSWDPFLNEHSFLVNGLYSAIQFYPYPTSLGVTSFMLGPLYYSTDYP